MPFAGWSPVGIAAIVAIVAGFVLLVVYAVDRGLVHRELEGMDAADPRDTEAPSATVGPPRRSRTLGALGTALIVAGLALGVAGAIGAPGSGQAAGGPGASPNDCAQAWGGCPKTTPRP
jgi:hypothetical protein